MLRGKVKQRMNTFLTISAFLTAEAVAQVGHGDATIEHVRVQPRGLVTEIYYDLNGSPNATYRIVLTLRSRSNESLNRDLVVTDGDVGAGVSPGPNKKVIWGHTGEFPAGLPGNDYFVQVRTEEMTSESMRGLWFGAGAFALCVVLFLVGMHDLTNVGLHSPSAHPQWH